MSELLVIHNPAAGFEPSRLEMIRSLAARYGAELLPPHRGHELPKRLASAWNRGTRRFLVAGGDGSVSRVVNALGDFRAEAEVGIVPLGTGNDLARSLGMPLFDLEQAFDLAATWPTIPIDLIQVSNGSSVVVVNAATAGFGAEVTAAVTTLDKQQWGAFAYWLTATSKLADRHPFSIELLVDDTPLKMTALGLTIANGRYIGGAFPVAHQARLNDGLLDLVVIPALSNMELLATGVRYLAGWTPEELNLLIKTARRIAVRAVPSMPFSLDGEPVCAMDATFEIAPGQLRVVAGPSPALIPPQRSDS